MLVGYALQPPSVSPPPLSFYYLLTFLATLLMGEPALLDLGGFSQLSGVAVSLMSAEQVNLFITLWLTFLGGAGILESHRVSL